MGGKNEQKVLEKAKEKPGQIFVPAQQEELIRREAQGAGQPEENPVSTVVHRTATTVGPRFPQEAPAGKFSHRQILGKLDERERTGTQSDEQRIGTKQYLLDIVALDGKKKRSKPFKDILEAIKEYASINVTGDGDKELLRKESDLLTKAMRDISSRAEELRQEGVRRKDEMEELELLAIYEEYFKIDTGGYLEVPPEGELIDYGEKELDGTYKVGEGERHSITLKEVPKEKPLFPHEPSVNDIAQGKLGDCYLLSGLAAIVHASPQMIKDCMRDNGNGTVTVRFYKNAEGLNQPMKPVYVRVKKSVPEGDVYARGCLWVQMMEKAYAASGLHSSQDPSYNAIEGGTSDQFISRLTGKRAAREMKTKPAKETDNYFDAFMDSIREKHETDGMVREVTIQAEALGIPLTGEVTADDIFQIGTVTFNYIQFFETVKDKKISSQEQAKEFFDHLKLEELPDIIPKEKQTDEIQIERNRNMKETALQQIRSFMLSFLPHEAFSGLYSAHAEELYTKIQESVKRGEKVTASTEVSFGEGEVKALNGEGMVLGLVSNHAYTVMGVKQMGQNKYIQLRNPWAHMGRTYEKDTRSGRITRNAQNGGNHGIFLVELNEFVTYYKSVGIL